MKNKLNVLKQCIKSNNLAEQLDNINFKEREILVFSSDGNFVSCVNDTPIRGLVNGVSFNRVVSSFANVEYVNSEENLIIKEGRKKATLTKYILSQGEDSFELPQDDDEKIIKIDEALIESIKMCMFSAQESILNQSGDGVMLKIDKFSKIYSTNGKTLTIGNVFLKGDHCKIFIPNFIAQNIIKYYNKDISELRYSERYIKYFNGDFTFTSMRNETEQEVNLEELVSKLQNVSQDITISKELKEELLSIFTLSDDSVNIQFRNNKIKVVCSSGVMSVEDEIDLMNGIDCNMTINKNYLIHAINNFDIMSVADTTSIRILKFKKGKITLIVSPMLKQ